MNKKSLMIIGVVVLLTITLYNSQIDLGPFALDRDSGFSESSGVASVPSLKECLTAFGCDANGCETHRATPRLSEEFVRACLNEYLELLRDATDPLGDDDNDGTPNYDDPNDDDPCIPYEDNDACENQQNPPFPTQCLISLGIIMGNWDCEGINCIGDYNGDGVVDVHDILDLFRDWPDCDELL
jgi:hypothetical protein